VKIYIIAWGKIKEKFYKEGVEFYLKRIQNYITVEHIELKEKEVTNQSILKIKNYLPKNCEFWLLDDKGKEFTSSELAKLIENKKNYSGKNIVFLIGGPFGGVLLSDVADFKISLSKLTLPHRLARLVLVEQIYRSMTIIAGEPYNH